jgi:hypothetical protein
MEIGVLHRQQEVSRLVNNPITKIPPTKIPLEDIRMYLTLLKRNDSKN